MTTSPALSARGICFGYSDDDVLQSVDLDVRAGEVVALAGHNGSGKSTLIEILAGVSRPRRGAVRRDGDLALVVQRPRVPDSLPLTAADVVRMGTWNRGARISRVAARRLVARALERVGMSESADRPLAELSGGQRQRVFLAQGIVRAPGILLLDEAAAGLDRESTARMQVILHEEAARGAAVCTVTHHDDAVAAADRVVRLERGRVV
ncbi:metal ABC transporter ATP-binding protein [Microbacterium hydrocarbonoxydans]|uniref:metal ABC transporter ATP-binding protein n=1 Tax=Microbacterium hydrocarbonoxydans TaxID=273678 RepID=UPI00203B0E6A|nr:ATP-binding cassette domain-containing protein [Microbacterium hydrocarbonoxydans]MCM3779702.1 ATP-binding cassette domain-containing protein [Microbacterium hydrocarbonoxydans]